MHVIRRGVSAPVVMHSVAGGALRVLKRKARIPLLLVGGPFG
jgi:hypothetical protein